VKTSIRIKQGLCGLSLGLALLCSRFASAYTPPPIAPTWSANGSYSVSWSVQCTNGCVAQWLEARTLTGADRRAMGAQAIEKVDRAIRHIHEIDSALKGTWGAYDLERSHMLWLEGLRRRLDE